MHTELRQEAGTGLPADPLLDRLLRYFAQQPRQIPEPILPPGAQDLDPAIVACYRQAAVLIPVIRPSSAQASSVLFTVRTHTLRTHAGQVSFPGGTMDTADSDPVATALRESNEEIGLNAGSVQVLGQLGQILLPSGFCVTPVVGVIGSDVLFTPAPGEVADIFQAPSSLVLNPQHYQRRQINWQNIERQILELHYQHYRIWGATAAILHHLGSELERGLVGPA